MSDETQDQDGPEREANVHKNKPLPPAPPDLAGRVFDVLARGAVLDAGTIATFLGTTASAHLIVLRQIEAVLCDRPEIFDHNGRGWLVRKGAKRPEPADKPAIAVEHSESSTWKSRCMVEQRSRELLELKVGNQRRHMARQHELLETLCRELAEATDVDAEEVLARLVREQQDAGDRHAAAEIRQKLATTPDAVRPRLAPAREGSADYRAIIRQLGNPTIAEIAKASERKYHAVWIWIKVHRGELDFEKGMPKRIRLRGAA